MPTSLLYQETQLVALLKAKNEQSFSYLYNRYNEALYNKIIHLISDQEYAKDVLQDVFRKIWQKIDYYDASKGGLYTWMLQVTHNITIDTLRSKSFRSATTEKSIDMISKGGSCIADENCPTGEQIINNITLKQAIEHLNHKYSSLIYLFYINGYTHSQIAQIEQLPIGTIKTRLRQAIVQLKDQLCFDRCIQASTATI